MSPAAQRLAMATSDSPGPSWQIKSNTPLHSSLQGIIIDPTIKMEQGYDQPKEVDAENKKINEPTIPYFFK